MLKIFQKNIIYEERQSLSISSDTLQAVSITKDLETIVAGSKDEIARILKRANDDYVLNQSIAIGFNILEVFITNESLAVAGASNQILFFSSNGTEFIIDQVLITD